MDLIEILMSLLTLTALEIVLGIDNLVFLSIMSNRLPT
ncbi:MAG: TerC family protein, partial [Candidatus Competibacter denitrificans]